MSGADYFDKVSEVDLYFGEVEDFVEELINESWETINLCGYEWLAGTLLRRADPIAFGEEVLSFISDRVDSGDWVEL